MKIFVVVVEIRPTFMWILETFHLQPKQALQGKNMRAKPQNKVRIFATLRSGVTDSNCSSIGAVSFFFFF